MAKRTTPRAQAQDTASAARPARARKSNSTADAPPAEPFATPPVSDISEPSEDDIRRRAYERYLERGGQHGMDFEDWLAAEQDLRSKK